MAVGMMRDTCHIIITHITSSYGNPPVHISADGRKHIAVGDIIGSQLEVALYVRAADEQHVVPAPLCV
jgi:hypothetical protein